MSGQEALKAVPEANEDKMDEDKHKKDSLKKSTKGVAKGEAQQSQMKELSKRSSRKTSKNEYIDPSSPTQEKMKEKIRPRNSSVKRRPRTKPSIEPPEQKTSASHKHRQKTSSPKNTPVSSQTPKIKQIQKSTPHSGERPRAAQSPYLRPSQSVERNRNPQSNQTSEQKSESEEEAPSAKVKQFSFPGHKILSGASVAPVRMYPQQVVIKRSERGDDEENQHWTDGLFHYTKMSLKLRMIRIFLLWIFFRLINKQTAWLSEKLGLLSEDFFENEMKPPNPKPGERYMRVFPEGSPHPIYVRVNRPGVKPEDI